MLQSVTWPALFAQYFSQRMQKETSFTVLFTERFNPFIAMFLWFKLNIKFAKTQTLFSNNVNTAIRKYSSRAFIWVVSPLGFVQDLEVFLVWSNSPLAMKELIWIQLIPVFHRENRFTRSSRLFRRLITIICCNWQEWPLICGCQIPRTLIMLVIVQICC